MFFCNNVDMSFLSINNIRLSRNITLLYVIAFFVVVLVGNMMARTTTVGVVVAFLFWIACSVVNRKNGQVSLLWKCLTVVSLIIVPFIVIQYNLDPAFKEKIRFYIATMICDCRYVGFPFGNCCMGIVSIME